MAAVLTFGKCSPHVLKQSQQTSGRLTLWRHVKMVKYMPRKVAIEAASLVSNYCYCTAL